MALWGCSVRWCTETMERRLVLPFPGQHLGPKSSRGCHVQVFLHHWAFLKVAPEHGEMSWCSVNWKKKTQIPEVGKVAAYTNMWHLLSGAPLAHLGCSWWELLLEWHKLQVLALASRWAGLLQGAINPRIDSPSSSTRGALVSPALGWELPPTGTRCRALQLPPPGTSSCKQNLIRAECCIKQQIHEDLHS